MPVSKQNLEIMRNDGDYVTLSDPARGRPEVRVGIPIGLLVMIARASHFTADRAAIEAELIAFVDRLGT